VRDVHAGRGEAARDSKGLAVDVYRVLGIGA
jgi:hypothetical protein